MPEQHTPQPNQRRWPCYLLTGAMLVGSVEYAHDWQEVTAPTTWTVNFLGFGSTARPTSETAAEPTATASPTEEITGSAPVSPEGDRPSDPATEPTTPPKTHKPKVAQAEYTLSAAEQGCLDTIDPLNILGKKLIGEIDYDNLNDAGSIFESMRISSALLRGEVIDPSKEVLVSFKKHLGTSPDLAVDVQDGETAGPFIGSKQFPSPATTARAHPNPHEAGAALHEKFQKFKAAGIDTVVGLSADVNTPHNDSLVSEQTFSNLPEVTAQYVKEEVRALNALSMNAVFGHFPGNGPMTMLKKGEPMASASFNTRDLYPFQKKIIQNAGIMVTSAVVPRLGKSSASLEATTYEAVGSEGMKAWNLTRNITYSDNQTPPEYSISPAEAALQFFAAGGDKYFVDMDDKQTLQQIQDMFEVRMKKDSEFANMVQNSFVDILASEEKVPCVYVAELAKNSF